MKPYLYPKLTAVFAFTVGAVLFIGSVIAQEHGTTHDARHKGNSAQAADFAVREQAVMPFDVTATLHVFEDTATGGVQRVLADDPDDAENITLIRSHLKDEAARFAKGDFSDPGFLHGEEMPGLADLEAAGAAAQLTVSYDELADGAEISYVSDDPRVVIALHLWFQAQVVDHGEHATN